MGAGPLIVSFIAIVIIAAGSAVAFVLYRNMLREAKNYERGLKMVPLLIHLPPTSEDVDSSNRDERDLTEEVLSQAQVMYNIISSTATKDSKAKSTASVICRLRLLLMVDWFIITPSFR